MFSLRFSGGGFTDFYPYELELKEGLSRVFRGKLALLSGTRHTMEELADLLDQRVSLSLTQRLADERTYRTRWLHGIVSAVECGGIITGAGKQDCYLTVLTIEPALARLRHTLHSESFSRLNPADIAERILARSGIEGFFAEDYIDRRKYGQHLLFVESDESRLDFLERILRLYGLSYTFRHPKAEASQLKDEELYFSDGERFPVSDVAYSDNRKVPAVKRFDFLSKDEGQSLWKMDGWTMESCIGMDGINLSAPYPESSRRNYEWRRGTGSRFYDYTSQFHAYERGTMEAEVDADLKLILDASYLALHLAKTSWEGAAENLELLPGVMLELAHFYGSGDKDLITALVTGSWLRARTVWPADMAAPPEAAQGELVELRISCIDFGRDSQKRFVPIQGRQ
jgi:hypothetical protein